MQIDLFHDTVCPWCRIGKRHLKIALDDWEGEAVRIRYRSFFLNPDIPLEGTDFRSHLLAKGNGQISLDQWFEGPRRMGAAAGLIFNFEEIDRAPNTLLSHRLIALAPEESKEALVDGIYQAYFEQGCDIGRLEELIAIAEEQGFEGDLIQTQLTGDAAREEVLADVQWAGELGIRGVPFFVFQGKYAISGAQPPQVISQVLTEVARLEQEES